MTAILEFKQKIKNLYGQYEVYILPVIKFVVALLYFVWINENMGYMTQIDNIFIVLILALICCILPPTATILAGCLLIVAHCYAVGIEVAGFMLVLLLLMVIFFLRFSAGSNIVLAFTPLSFGFNLQVLLPIGSGLLGSPLTAIPAGCGVILYYFIRYIRAQSQVLMSGDMEILQKLQLMADGLVQNWAMWITVVAFVGVILLVNLIRTRSFDYAWRIAIVAGGVTYVLIMLAGGLFLNVRINLTPLIVYTVIGVVVGMLLELFVFGGDYSRTERMEYEDDEYYYYVKAVPKAAVATSERSIKKINAEPAREETPAGDNIVSYANPIFGGESKREDPEPDASPAPVEKQELDDIDFERKLEESLKDL